MAGDLVLVTGASGYIATHIVQQLQQAGYKVRGTVRSLQNEDKVQPLRDLCPGAAYPIELFEADLENQESWLPAVQGCKFVMHVAAPIPAENPKHEDEVVKPAVEGTLNILRAVKDAKCVQRVIMTGSAGSIMNGWAFDGSMTYTENQWTDTTKDDCGAYPKSKTLAEKAAWDFVNSIENESEKFELSVMNPSYVCGPILCGTTRASMELPRRLLQREMPMLPRLNFAIVDVRDVAAAHLAAMTSDAAAGQRHILSTGNMWLSAIAALYNQEFKSQGYNCPTTEAPYCAMWLYGRFDRDVRMLLPSIGQNMNLDNSRMLNVLKIKGRAVEDSMIDMAYSMIEKGFIKKTSKYRGLPSNGVGHVN